MLTPDVSMESSFSAHQPDKSFEDEDNLEEDDLSLDLSLDSGNNSDSLNDLDFSPKEKSKKITVYPCRNQRKFYSVIVGKCCGVFMSW